MRILFLLTYSLLLTSITNAQTDRHDSARCFVSVKDFDPGRNVVKVEASGSCLYFSQKDFFGFKKQNDTIFYKLDTSNEYTCDELLRRGRGLVYDRTANMFADSISYYTSLYGLRHFYLSGEKHLFWVLAFFRGVSLIPDKKTGADYVIRRERRTFPGQFLEKKPGICDSVYNNY